MFYGRSNVYAWEWLGGLGLVGLILGIATLELGVIAVSILILLACAWHWSHS